jgi:hypothetical protein
MANSPNKDGNAELIAAEGSRTAESLLSKAPSGATWNRIKRSLLATTDSLLSLGVASKLTESQALLRRMKEQWWRGIQGSRAN